MLLLVVCIMTILMLYDLSLLGVADSKPYTLPSTGILSWEVGNGKIGDVNCSNYEIYNMYFLFSLTYCSLTLNCQSDLQTLKVRLGHLMRKGTLALCGLCSFKRACAAIQWGQISSSLSEAFSTSLYCVSKQRRLWQDCANAQPRLSLCSSHLR